MDTAAAALDLGPHLHVYFAECHKESKFAFGFILVTAGLATLVACLLSVKHRWEILAAPISLQRLYYFRITWFAPAFGLTSFLTLLCPRGFSLLKMVQLQFEGINIMVFGTILFLLLAVESHQQCKNSSLHTAGIGQKILSSLATQGPKPHFGVPPFGCCFRCWIPHHDLTARHLMLAQSFFKQFVFVILATSLFSAWSVISLSVERFALVHKIALILQKVSGFVAIYGLMILYVATRDLLHDKWRTTAKFIAIKLVVLLCTFQDMLVGMALKVFKAMEFECLGSESHNEHFWGMYLSALESIIIALLAARAFPASEVYPFEGEVHLDIHLVEMELEALDTPIGVQADTLDSDSDSCNSESAP